MQEVQKKIDWQKWGVIVALFSVILAVIEFIIPGSPAISQDVNNSPGSINTVGQVGNNTIVNSYRSITNEQKSLLKSKLAKDPGKVGFVSKLFDPEAANFASKLSDIFRDSGWKIIGKLNPTLANSFDGDISIFARPEMYARADLINLSLSEVGLVYASEHIPDNWVSGKFENDTVYVIVDSQAQK